MGKLQKTPQGLTQIISKDLLKISPNDLNVEVQKEIDHARESVETYEEYETKLAVISQRRALALADIEQEWVNKCKTPKEAIKVLKDVNTLDQALDTLAPTMYKIQKLTDKKTVIAYIASWLVYLQGNLNLKNKLNEEMLVELSEYILTLFGYLTIADVKNVISDALRGVYGEFYETLSMHKVLTWFRDYSERRMSECEARSFSEHSYTKNESVGWKDRRRSATLSAKDMLDINKAKNES